MGNLVISSQGCVYSWAFRSAERRIPGPAMDSRRHAAHRISPDASCGSIITRSRWQFVSRPNARCPGEDLHVGADRGSEFADQPAYRELRPVGAISILPLLTTPGSHPAASYLGRPQFSFNCLLGRMNLVRTRASLSKTEKIWSPSADETDSYLHFRWSAMIFWLSVRDCVGGRDELRQRHRDLSSRFASRSAVCRHLPKVTPRVPHGCAAIAVGMSAGCSMDTAPAAIARL